MHQKNITSLIKSISFFVSLLLIFFSLAANFLNVPQSATAALQQSVPNNFITSFQTVEYNDDRLRQFLVRGGRIIRRVESTVSGWDNWEDITSFVNTPTQVGSGQITSFSVEVYQDNLQRQFLVRGGEIYRRTQTATDWTNWENITYFVNTPTQVGSGVISAFHVGLYDDNYLRQFLTRGGRVYRRTENASGWSNWEDISSLLEYKGYGSISSFSSNVWTGFTNNRVNYQYAIKGNDIYQRSDLNWNIWTKSTSSYDQVGEEPKVEKKVLAVIFDPLMSNGQKLSLYKSWETPVHLLQNYQHWMNSNQRSYNYTITQTVEFNQWNQTPIKETSGEQYDEASYLDCLSVEEGEPIGYDCLNPDIARYDLIVQSIDLCTKVNAGLVDEVWLMGGPWFGFFESRLTGPNAFPYNSPPLTGTNCNKLVPIMGFNYERGLAQMLHSFGHRSEQTMKYVFGSQEQNQLTHNWNGFVMNNYLSSSYSYSGCSTVHYPPNATRQDNAGYFYEYDNATTTTPSYCASFSANYPTVTTPPTDFQQINCNHWGCTQEGYMNWWLKMFPTKTGIGPNGKHNNWWIYTIDPNRVFDTD